MGSGKHPGSLQKSGVGVAALNGGSNHPQPSVWGGVGPFPPSQTADPSSDPFRDRGDGGRPVFRVSVRGREPRAWLEWEMLPALLRAVSCP